MSGDGWTARGVLRGSGGVVHHGCRQRGVKTYEPGNFGGSRRAPSLIRWIIIGGIGELKERGVRHHAAHREVLTNVVLHQRK